MRFPKPTIDEPRTSEEMYEVLRDVEMEGTCEATDGCWVEPDGICEHGHPSWLLYWGLI